MDGLGYVAQMSVLLFFVGPVGCNVCFECLISPRYYSPENSHWQFKNKHLLCTVSPFKHSDFPHVFLGVNIDLNFQHFSFFMTLKLTLWDFSPQMFPKEMRWEAISPFLGGNASESMKDVPFPLRWEILTSGNPRTSEMWWISCPFVLVEDQRILHTVYVKMPISSDFTWTWAKWPFHFVTGRTKISHLCLTSIFWEHHDVFCSHGWSTKKTLARSCFKDGDFRCWVGKCFFSFE